MNVQKEMNTIIGFNNYLKNEIDNYNTIKSLSKNIDKSFLVKIKNISYLCIHKIVVFPALSSPKINSLTSSFEKSDPKILEKINIFRPKY